MTEQTKSVELYTLSTCPWSRKALAFLDGKAVDYSYIDYDLADHGDQVAVPFGLHLEHGPSVLLVVERNAFDQPGKAFMWSI